MSWTIIIIGVAVVAIALTIPGIYTNVEPNEVVVKSGMGAKSVKRGGVFNIPLIHRLDSLDVRNMTIEVLVDNAYSKGGIPLRVDAVAQVKIATRSDQILDRAIERFLNKGRNQVKKIARETLEGNLRGVLATMTPEEVNEDREIFKKRISNEAKPDLELMGLNLNSLQIQSVTDDQGYLDSIGRKQSAELIKNSRIAEAENRAEASVRDAENQLRKAQAKIESKKEIARAEAERRIADARSKAEAMIAEERSKIGAAVAKAEANLDVQQARLEQVKRQLAADVIQPAQAEKAELESQAKAQAAKVIEDGKADVEALRDLLETWNEAGDAARPLFLIQKFDAVMDAMMSTIQEIEIDKVTVIDSEIDEVDKQGTAPMKAASGAEQIKETLGLDLPKMVQGLSAMQESDEKRFSPSDGAE